MKYHILIPRLMAVLLVLAGVSLADLLAQSAKEIPSPLPFSFACRFSFPRYSRVYLVNEAPPTLLYRQRFRTFSAFENSGRDGLLQMKFLKGELVLEGLGLEAKGTDIILKEEDAPEPFQPTLEANGVAGTDMFPTSRHFPVSKDASFFSGLSLDGSKSTIYLSIVIKDWKTRIVLMDDLPPKGKEIAHYDYEDMYQGPFWARAWDLDGDGLDEIVLGQFSYSRRALIIFSRKPSNFSETNALATRISEFGNWPAIGAEIFQKGQVTKIPLLEKPSP